MELGRLPLLRRALYVRPHLGRNEAHRAQPIGVSASSTHTLGCL